MQKCGHDGQDSEAGRPFYCEKTFRIVFVDCFTAAAAAAVNDDDDDAPSMTSRQFICRLARSTNKNRAWGRCHKQIFEYNTYVKIMHSDRSKHVTCIMQ